MRQVDPQTFVCQWVGCRWLGKDLFFSSRLNVVIIAHILFKVSLTIWQYCLPSSVPEAPESTTMGEDEVHNGVGNLGPTILAVDWVFWSLSTTIVLLRLGTRTWITRNFGWDDTTIGFALVSSCERVIVDHSNSIMAPQALNVVGKSFTIEEVANGLGQQNQDLSPASYTEYLKYNYFDWNQVILYLVPNLGPGLIVAILRSSLTYPWPKYLSACFFYVSLNSTDFNMFCMA